MEMETDRFYKMLQDMAARTDLKATDKLIYAVISNYRNENGQAWPGMRILAKDTGCSVNTVERSVKRLEEVGLLVVKRRESGKTNVYRTSESAPVLGTVTVSAPKMGTVPDTQSAPKMGVGAPKMGTEAPPKWGHKRRDLIRDLTVTGKKTAKTKKAVQQKEFIVPTLKEVSDHIKEKSYIVDPNVFYEWYSVHKWTKSSGEPLESWKLALAQWNAKDMKDRKEGSHGKISDQQSSIGTTIRV